mmetsp:Transcript_44452/g.105335  ORF Transcript_44452/g.105335 Transcript_44452/m.105335 type:complete len:202 (-) Transcript_44452:123-728(-)
MRSDVPQRYLYRHSKQHTHKCKEQDVHKVRRRTMQEATARETALKLSKQACQHGKKRCLANPLATILLLAALPPTKSTHQGIGCNCLHTLQHCCLGVSHKARVMNPQTIVNCLAEHLLYSICPSQSIRLLHRPSRVISSTLKLKMQVLATAKVQLRAADVFPCHKASWKFSKCTQPREAVSHKHRVNTRAFAQPCKGLQEA